MSEIVRWKLLSGFASGSGDYVAYADYVAVLTQQIAAHNAALQQLSADSLAALAGKDEQLAALTAENKRLREAMQEALATAEAEWLAVNNHPGSSYARDVAYYRAALAPQPPDDKGRTE